jgi:hypothetical protein
MKALHFFEAWGRADATSRVPSVKIIGIFCSQTFMGTEGGAILRVDRV